MIHRRYATFRAMLSAREFTSVMYRACQNWIYEPKPCTPHFEHLAATAGNSFISTLFIMTSTRTKTTSSGIGSGGKAWVFKAGAPTGSGRGGAFRRLTGT